MSKELGRRVRRYRRATGMSVAEFANKVCLTRDHIYKIEAGQREPSLPCVMRLAAALDVPVSLLVD